MWPETPRPPTRAKRRQSRPGRGFARGSRPTSTAPSVKRVSRRDQRPGGGSRRAPAGPAAAQGSRPRLRRRGSDGLLRRSPCHTFLKYKRSSSNARNARKLRPRSRARTTPAGRTAPSGRGPSGRAWGLGGHEAAPSPVLGLRPERAARPGGGETAPRPPPAGSEVGRGSKAPPQPRPHLHPGSGRAGGAGAGQPEPRGRRAWPGLPATAAAPPAPTGTHR